MFIKIILSLIAAFIWGTSFVAQSLGADVLPPFAFNAARSFVAVIAIALILLIFNKTKPFQKEAEKQNGNIKKLIIGGICCGIPLTIAINLQQMGLGETDAGKAGFITALYIVLIPIFGLFLRRRTSFSTVISVAIAVVGMYLLCIGSSFSIKTSELYLIVCAICFAIHILVIDKFAPQTNCIALSLVQFAFAAIASTILSLIFESATLSGLIACSGQLVYVGVLSSGVAYTLQILALDGSDPTVVSLLFSLESVFSVIAGTIVLQEKMSRQEYLGCFLILLAVMLSQIPASVIKKLLHIKQK